MILNLGRNAVQQQSTFIIRCKSDIIYNNNKMVFVIYLRL